MAKPRPPVRSEPEPPLLDQLEELKDALGQKSLSDFIVFGLTRTEEKMLGLLMARDWCSKESVITVLYADYAVADRPADSTIDVYAHNIKKKLKAHGIKLSTRFGEGWYLTVEDKRKLREVVAAYKREAAAISAPPAPDAATISIDKNVPLPTAHVTKYPFEAMEPGDSFKVADGKVVTGQSAIRHYRVKSKTSAKFIVRPEGDGYRIWRKS